jgi:hypothetical protein
MIDALPLLLGPEGYQISRSVRLRSSASAYLNRTPASAGNRKTWTWSGWVKLGVLGTDRVLFSATNGTTFDQLRYSSSNNSLQLSLNNGTYNINTSALFRDPSSWYHVLFYCDTTNATNTERIQIWVNGIRQAVTSATYPVLNYDTYVNSTNAHQIGRVGTSGYFDGYLTEINFIDGQALTPSSFGETNPVTGVWQPKKYGGTYGTNGFYLNFSDNSAVTTSSNVGIGKDFSGNGNYWTSNSISVTAGATYDSMIDVPTPYDDGNSGRGNYAVLSPINPTANTPSDGNLRGVMGASENGITSTMAIPSGVNAYWEVASASTTSASVGCYAGVASLGVSMAQSASYNKTGVWAMIAVNIRQLYANGSAGSSVASTLASTSILQVAVDNTSSGSNTYVWIGVDNVFYNSTMGTTGNPATGANPTFTISKQDLTAFLSGYLDTVFINFGQRPFSYTPPTGFKALNTQNLPTPTISNGAQYMAATTYTGTGASQNISNAVNGISMQPDLIWIKRRNAVYDHDLFDAVRGAGLSLYSSSTAAEGSGEGQDSFNTNGFTVSGNHNRVNISGGTFAAWQWNAGGSTVTNTSGSISAQVRANTTAGFSVVTWTGTTASSATIGHGLGVAPSMIIVKNRSRASTLWCVYTSTTGNTKALNLNDTSTGITDIGFWNNTNPTSTVFTTGNGYAYYVGGIADNYVAYCFAAVAGYSAFGSYTGNGSTDGPFVYLGFRPRWLMIKNITNAQPWIIVDTSRNTYNQAGDYLQANSSAAENGGSAVSTATADDILSNGFKLRNNASSSGYTNGSGDTYIYAAFAEVPFKSALGR